MPAVQWTRVGEQLGAGPLCSDRGSAPSPALAELLGGARLAPPGGQLCPVSEACAVRGGARPTSMGCIRKTGERQDLFLHLTPL